MGSEVTWYFTATSRSLREPSVSTFAATKSWALRATHGSAYVVLSSRWHQPHQSAQKSTMIGLPALRAFFERLARSSSPT